ncbi:MAG: prepilin-type N-terminal cleavage/methylation domain-containing protein, partial [Gemmatimonadota bacterium]|nr:prepilin-type N-terminal cleavage/methylation domain-containing protein [Gemmatimonadota bacterium]
MSITQTLYGVPLGIESAGRPKKLDRCVMNSRGFTVIEVLAALAIAATLTAIAVPQITTSIENARVAAAIGDIVTLQNDIATFEGLNDRLPNDLAEIGRSGITDPWGNEYEYVNFEYVTGSTRQSTWARVA